MFLIAVFQQVVIKCLEEGGLFFLFAKGVIGAFSSLDMATGTRQGGLFQKSRRSASRAAPAW